MISYFASSSDSVLMNTVDENNIFVADCVRKIYAYTPLIKIPLKIRKAVQFLLGIPIITAMCCMFYNGYSKRLEV